MKWFLFPQRSAALNVSQSHGRVCPPRPPLLLQTPVAQMLWSCLQFTACDGCWVVNICRFSFGYTLKSPEGMMWSFMMSWSWVVLIPCQNVYRPLPLLLAVSRWPLIWWTDCFGKTPNSTFINITGNNYQHLCTECLVSFFTFLFLGRYWKLILLGLGYFFLDGHGSDSSMSILATWPQFPQSLQLSQSRWVSLLFFVCLFVCELLQVLPSCGNWVVHDGSFYITLLMIWVSCSVETNLYRSVSLLHFRSNSLILIDSENCYNLLHLKL